VLTSQLPLRKTVKPLTMMMMVKKKNWKWSVVDLVV
jgi:hypothetical protein